MPKRYSSREVITTLRKAGFLFVSQKGSHMKFARRGATVIVPAERKQIPAGTFGSIVRQSKLKAEDFE